MNKAEIEKSLKRFLKRKVGYSFALLVAFMISGEISLAVEENNQLNAQKVAEETSLNEAEDLVSFAKIMKKKLTIKKSEEKSTQFFFNVWLEHRHAGKYDKNGYGNGKKTDEITEIEIPDVKDPVKPSIPEDIKPLPEDKDIITEPKFDFTEMGKIEAPDIPSDIDITVNPPALADAIENLDDSKFGGFADGDVIPPETIGSIGDVNVPSIGKDLKPNVREPEISYDGEIKEFTPPELGSAGPGEIKAPGDFTRTNLAVTGGGFSQGAGIGRPGMNNYADVHPIVIENFDNYSTTDGISINFDNMGISSTGSVTATGRFGPWNPAVINTYDTFKSQFANIYGNIPTTTGVFINDLRDKDVTISGEYNINYENGQTGHQRMFLSSNPAAVGNFSMYDSIYEKTTKITEFTQQSILNLSTSGNGALIGMEHQLYEKYESGTVDNFKNSRSVLLNSGIINLSSGKNMIGIMVDQEHYSWNAERIHNNMTINNGTININDGVTNSIGFSFEPYTGTGPLRDDAYLGTINVNGSNNYGFRMANIFDNNGTYFDKATIIGKAGTIAIMDPDGITIKKSIENYVSEIVVNGTQNVGMVIGKSLSNGASGYEGASENKVNPIANFHNISITVNGDQTIGFVRDKDYSDNNTNDMVINNKNINDIKFGSNAVNSVLFRTEKYGITLDNGYTLDVSGGKEQNGTYNVAMQATNLGGDAKVENRGTISNTTTEVSNMVGMMASGTTAGAEAFNYGFINLKGNKNIGMAVLERNTGNLITEAGKQATVIITGDNSVGAYNNKGTFNIKGDTDTKAQAIISVNGNNSIGVYNTGSGTINFDEAEIDISAGDKENVLGVVSNGGTLNFEGDTTINTVAVTKADEKFTSVGVYNTGDVTMGFNGGSLTVNNATTGIVAENGTTNIKTGNITYSGNSYALYAKENGKIVFDEGTSTNKDNPISHLTLDGSAYGANIDITKQGTDKLIDFNNAEIIVKSKDVVLFNMINKSNDKTLITIDGDNYKPNDQNLDKYVGKYTVEITPDGEGYKTASIDGGLINLQDINLNDGVDSNIEILKMYKFQRSEANVLTDINKVISTEDAEKYYNGEVIGIGMSSSENLINTTGEGQRAETVININGATVTADRTDAQSEKKATIGAYIDFGEINMNNGHIVVEKENNVYQNDKSNDNAIGIYAKNGSKVTTSADSAIDVYGNNAVGIFAEAAIEDEAGENKFGGKLTNVEISNEGTITLSGQSGTGIYVNNQDSKLTDKATISNTGKIDVGQGGSTADNSSVGIYGINTEITNTGTIEIGCNCENVQDGAYASVGIYAQDSVVKVSSVAQTNTDKQYTALGDNAVGIYLDGGSSFNVNPDGKLVFKNLKRAGDAAANNTTRTGIYLASEEGKTNSEVNINFDIDMSEVTNGRAVVADGRNVIVAAGETVTVSGDGGKGVRISEGTATNNGEIIINAVQTVNSSAAGMMAVDKDGILINNGTITVNSKDGIGIYAENGKNSENSGNTITNAGAIALTEEGSIGIVSKNAAVTLNGNSNITMTADKGNIGVHAVGAEASVTNNAGTINVASSAQDKDKNIGVYLAEGASYSGAADADGNITGGTVEVANGSIGIYADKGSIDVKNVNISSTAGDNQTIGVVLKSDTKETKNISGKVTLSTVQDKDGAKNIAVYAQNSSVNIDGILTINHDGSDGTGIYLDNSSLTGSGTLKIAGTGKAQDKVKDTIGIYYKGNSASAGHSVTIDIEKDNTIGVYAAEGSSLTRNGVLNIGSADENATKYSDITGVVANGSNTTITNGTGASININKVDKGIGMAAVNGGKLINNGAITITKNSISGTGVFLSGGNFDGTGGTIAIQGEGKTDHVGVGIYVKGQGNTITNTGKFDIAAGNVAVYADSAKLNTDINLTQEADKNSGVVALAAQGSSTIGGTADDKMKITIGTSYDGATTGAADVNAIGIYAKDSGVQIQNVSIDATAHIADKDILSYGIYLNADNTQAYQVSSTDVSVVKGVGIALGNGNTTTLNLTGSTLNINSYSETGQNKETGIGIYAGNNNVVNLAGGNTLNVSSGTGIYGENSTIDVGTGATADTINLQGYSVGVYSKGGVITLGEKTNVGFNGVTFTETAKGNDTNIVKGAAAYTKDGTITSSADITNGTGNNTKNLDGFIALLGQGSQDNSVSSTNVTNEGTIDLAGNKVSGIAVENGTATNKGTIAVTNTTKQGELSIGILANGGSITNEGTVEAKGASVAIAYEGNNTAAEIISQNNGTVKVSGERNIAVSLAGNAKKVDINKIEGTGTGNLGVYLNNFTAGTGTDEGIKIGTINLTGENSGGLYIANSDTANDYTTTINSLGQVTLGANGVGIAVTGKSSINGASNITINGDVNVEVGAGGTGVYVGKDSSLTLKSMTPVKVGLGGAFIYADGGTVKLNETVGNVTLKGTVGMVLENGGDVQLVNSKDKGIDTMTISDGGIGMIIRDGSKRASILTPDSKIVFDKNTSETDKYSVGIYYQNAGEILTNDTDKAVIEYKDGASNTIGTIFDRTYGELKNSNITMGANVSDSIGVFVRRSEVDAAGESTKGVTFTKKDDGTDLINISGKGNIGIAARDSIITANGNIVVNDNILDNVSDGDRNLGVYLMGGKGTKEIAHSYTGTGDITVGKDGIGIYGKDYNIKQTGNLTVTDGIGIVSMEKEDHTHNHEVSYSGSIAVSGEKENSAGIGIYAKGTNINSANERIEKLSVSGKDNIGIASLDKGNIKFNGAVNLNGENSIGLYKSTEEKDKHNPITASITTTKDNWIIGGKNTIGIFARANEGDIITINNKADIDLSSSEGGIGIYAVGANTVENEGNITTGKGLPGATESEDDSPSIGIYMANQFTQYKAAGINTGIITAEQYGSVGVQAAGNVEFTNKTGGQINVSDNAIGMLATVGANVINAAGAEINITGEGTGMIAKGNSDVLKSESTAINKGTINVKGNADNIYSSIGMAAYDGGYIINDTTGVINVENGIGMYIDETSTMKNDGKINLNGGIGVFGEGKVLNAGNIEILGNADNSEKVVEDGKVPDGTASIFVDHVNKVVTLNDNYMNIDDGTFLTDYALNINNVSVDLVSQTGAAGLIGKNISGDINLTSNFAYLVKGMYERKDFIDAGADVDVNTSKLYNAEIKDGDLIISKVAFSELMNNKRLDNAYNAMDNLAAGSDNEAAKVFADIGYYLDQVGQNRGNVAFDTALNHVMSGMQGDIYGNVQSRMQDIGRAFDNSFNEMVLSYNPTHENDKFSLIYGNGDYKNSNSDMVDYEYSITGLQYMKQYQTSEGKNRYGWQAGFTVADFDFDDSGSEEKVYSLRGGVHNVHTFENEAVLLSKAELGYNRHDVDRRVDFGANSYEDNAEFNSYDISIDNKLRKSVYKGEKTELGLYTGLNLEYGRFDDIKEKGAVGVKVKGNDYLSSKLFIGADGSFTHFLNNDWAAKLTGDIRYSYDLGENYKENEAKIKNGGTGYYSLLSEVESKGSAGAKVGIGLEKSDYMAVTLEGEYAQDFERDEDYWKVGLRFTYKFNTEDSIAVLRNSAGFLNNYFDTDKDTLKADDEKKVNDAAEFINKRDIKGTLVIEGHADSTGKENYNQILSEKRAKNVENEFKKNIKKAGNIQYDVKGYGETKPAADNNTSEGRAANRRVNVKFIDKR